MYYRGSNAARLRRKRVAAFYVLLRMYYPRLAQGLAVDHFCTSLCSDDAPVVAHQAAERSGAAWCLYEYGLMRDTVRDGEDAVATP